MASTFRAQIASPSNETTPPAHSTQPDGEAISWGIGQVKEANSNQTNSSASISSAVPLATKDAVPTAPAPTATTKSRHSENRLPKDDGNNASDSPEGHRDDNGDGESGDVDGRESADNDDDSTRSARVAGPKSGAARTSTGAYNHDSGSDNDPNSSTADQASDGTEPSGANNGHKNSGATVGDESASSGNRDAMASGAGFRFSRFSLLCSAFFALLGALVAF